jgi:hypothetical protein
MFRGNPTTDSLPYLKTNMTPDRAFECLFISRDPAVFSTMGGMLRDLSVSTNLCLSSSQALGMLAGGSTDLLVIDWEGDASSDLLRNIWKSRMRHKPTIVAISALASDIRGAHVTLRKPITAESGTKSLKVAYSRMLLDHRLHARYALMLPLHATDDNNRNIELIVTNIGAGGIGLSVEQKVIIGQVLALRVLLPGAMREIYIQARVLWTQQCGAVGCDFVRIPPVDLSILHDWLKSKARVKKPLIPM